MFRPATITGAGAVINTAKVTAGSTVAVFDCGGIGLSAVNGAAIAAADRIIAIDTVPSKLETAKLMGATDVINASKVDPVEAVKELTEGGVEYAFEAFGLQSSNQSRRGRFGRVAPAFPRGRNYPDRR
jgi:S-(hydroxymethyl)glutathione dehydrogenase / alcohol dehydrogenase